MKESGDSLAKSQGLPPEEELKHSRAAVRSLMSDAAKVLANIEVLSHGAEIDEEIHLLDHYLDRTKRLCQGPEEEVGDWERPSLSAQHLVFVPANFSALRNVAPFGRNIMNPPYERPVSSGCQQSG